MPRSIRGWVAPVVVAALTTGGCRKTPTQVDPPVPFEPGAATLLSTGSPTRDEDPSVLRTPDGRMLVAWFSDRGGGNQDIYLSSTTDGTTWTAAQRLTTSTGGDFYPNLFLDHQGIYHLTWFRWIALSVGSIFTSTSTDGASWSVASEVQVTTAPGVDDWVPIMTETADGTLVIVFVSQKRNPANPTSELYVTRKRPGDAAWSAPVAISAINSASEHDHLPYAALVNGSIRLVWVRSDTRNPVPWQNPKADLYTATSVDGLAWTAPARVTNESGDVVNVFPALYQSSAGEWTLLWLSNRTGTTRPYQMPLSQIGQYPAGRVDVTSLPTGYSHRIAATPESGVYLGVWVSGAEGAQEVYYQLFRP